MKENILDFDENIKKEPVKKVGFTERLVAYIVDIVPIAILVFLILYVGFGLNPFDKTNEPTGLFGDFLSGKALFRYLGFGTWVVYSLLMDASKYQGTHGKVIQGLKVVNAKGERISFSESVIRNLSKIISYLPLFLGFIWPAIDNRKRTWHDMISGTKVDFRE